MKSKITILFFSFIFLFKIGYCQTPKDSILLPPLGFSYLSSSKMDFNWYTYSDNLKKQVLPYLRKVDGIQSHQVYPISFNNYYFKDYYNIYNTDIGKFIPKSPDITKQSIPFEQ